MPLGADLILGPFNIAPDGKLTPRDPDNLKGFSVRWRGCTVHARMLLDGRLAFRATSRPGAEHGRRRPRHAASRFSPWCAACPPRCRAPGA